MIKNIFVVLLFLALSTDVEAQEKTMTSPDKRIEVKRVDTGFEVFHEGKQVLSMKGKPTPAPPEGRGSMLRLGEGSGPRHLHVSYDMVSGKRSHCENEANEYRYRIGGGKELVFRVFNDGVAFRYEGGSEELLSYRIPEGTRRWMQQWTDSYEGFFPLTTTYKVEPIPSFSGISKSAEGYNNRWGFPALLEPVSGTFVLLTEANIGRGQSAACLMSDGESLTPCPSPVGRGEKKASPTGGGLVGAWRLAIIGSLKDVAESTLVTDVSEPSKIADTSWIKPGTVSWIYWAYNHGSNDYDIIKQYVDMAEKLRLPYVLIDAEWDTMQGGHTIEDAINYAKQRGVRPMIWYNSSVGWVDGAPTPKYRLNKKEDREREFAWCERMGVAGVKIDFFSGDSQQNMDYQQDLLECAARHHLLVNFHGATIPRGWQRTWPNLLSTEAVYGAEWYNNVPTFTAKAARHNATLPFTRNVIGPMDYTPCTFSDSQHPHITTNAHELALTVLFESGLQHLADKPESYYAQPKEVQDFLSNLPTAWDETRLVAGYPGEYVVMARRKGTTWYVAGINGSDSVKTIPLQLDGIVKEDRFTKAFLDPPPAPPRGRDGGGWDILPIGGRLSPSVTCKPRGGFVFIIEEAVHNPMLWADVPDPDVIRVGDTFYMVSTTMHLMPGAPVMASKDLKNWETVGYIFDKLTDSPKYDMQNGTAYGRGQWATSLKYHNGRFYALFAPNENAPQPGPQHPGETYIMTAPQASGPWTLVSRMRHFHDCSLFFDDDGRVYVIYGTGELMELKPDLSDVIEGTHRQLFKREAEEKGLLEGSRMIKHRGKYYLLMISHTYAPGHHRREVCYRADNIEGPYEKQVILESEFGGFSYEAQGTIVDTEDGDWYGIIFQDRGGVGRVLTLMPCRWIDGWPMLGDENGMVPALVRPLKSGQPAASIVKSDDFSAERLGLQWQWNHNPIDKSWSLKERPGYLRLKTNRVVNTLYLAPNTLTQRMEGPQCSGAIEMDLSHMKDGDCAGLAAFNSDTGALCVKKRGGKLVLQMNELSVKLTDRDKEVAESKENCIAEIPLHQTKIWLRVDADFRPVEGRQGGRDAANFYYSLDGSEWTQIGTARYPLRFDWQRFFMGTKFGIFNYATKRTGGYVDINQFIYHKK